METLLEIMAPRLVRESKTLREAPREIPKGPVVVGGKRIESEGKAIAVFEVEEDLHAIDAVCPHEGGPLDQGVVENGCVTCPWHNYKFNLKTGACVNEPNFKVETYAVEREGEGFRIRKEEK
jgi:nitrite reductase/ring-hydroxylating ferredoxin subunit